MSNYTVPAAAEGMPAANPIDLDGALACAASLVGLAFDITMTHIRAVEAEDGTKEWRMPYAEGTQLCYVLPMIRDAAERALAEVAR